MEIVKLIGSDVLPEDQKLIIEIARTVRVGFLQQNAYHKDDTYVPLEKQHLMMGSILNLYENCKKAVAAGVSTAALLETGLFEKVIKIKYDIPNDCLEMFKQLDKEVEEGIKKTIREVT